MDCKITRSKYFAEGMTLVELMVAVGLGSLVLLVLASVTLYSARSFSSMNNYTKLNQVSRRGLDAITRELRESRGLVSRTPTSLVFKDSTGTNTLSFTWISTNQTLIQTKGGVNTVILDDCVFWTNQIFQRTPQSNTFNLIAASSAAQAKVIQLNWTCARRRVNTTNSETAQSMKVLIRKTS